MVAEYLRERVPLRVFGPVAIGLLAAASWASPGPVAALAVAAALDALLLLQFRLWDDLEDRERDRITHPHRVLVRADAAPLRKMVFLLGATSVAIAASVASPAAMGLTLLNAGFHAAYRGARRRISDRRWRFSILLVKYPIFVTVLATVTGTPRPGRLVVAAAVSYLVACAYEILHDSRPLEGVAS
jgi:hypothetical protein